MEFSWLNLIHVVSIAILGLVSLYVYKKTVNGGFGPYNTSTFIIILTITVAGIIGLADGLDNATIGNIFMGVIGFAAGIFAGKNDTNTSDSKTAPNKA